jgi:CubicO group peptidase (beta-lactamase class C family)
LVARADQEALVFRPGTTGAWKYSSTNYVILGMLIEKVTGRSLAQEMRERIFAPLDLQHTFFPPEEAVNGTVAQGYIGGSDRVELSMSFVFATGNLVSTVNDLRHFADALFGGRILQPESLALMTTVMDTRGAFRMPELRYGLGVMEAQMSVGPGPDGEERPEDVRTVLGHIGGVGGFRSAVWHAPETSITIALSVNQADIDPNVLARDVYDILLTWQGR